MAANRSPFEYLLNAPAGGGIAAAFQEGEAAASRKATDEMNRATQRLNQQLTGLSIEELQANAPLRAARRDWELGGMRELNTQFGAGLGAPATGLGFPASLIRTESGGNWGALNADTGAAGRLQFMESRLADAKRAGVIPANMTADQFRADPAAQQRAEQWHFADINRYITGNNLNQFVGQTVKGVTVTPDGMVAVAHLGGSAGLKRFLESGGQYDPADANGTKLSDYLRIHGGQAAAAPAQTQAQPRAIPNIPGMLGEAPMMLSPAGVPMTNVPEGDLQPTTGGQAQAGLSQSGTAQTPGGATVQVPGVPADAGADNRALGILQAIGGGIGSLFGSRFAGITGEGAPAAPAAPAVNLSAPSQLTLGGSAPIPATTFGSTMAGGTGTAGALSPTPFAGQATQGLLPTAAQQQAQRAQQQAAQPAGTIPAGLELIGPARQQLQQITQQRALLQQRMALARTLSPSEAAKELVAVQTENIALGRREMELRSDQAIGQMTMGQPQALDNIFQQTYGVRLQPVISNNRVTGYNLLRGNTVVAENVTPEALSRQARLGLNQTFREQEAAAALPLKKAQVDAWLETQKQLARATADTAIAQIKQQFTELAVAKQSETSFIVYDKNNPRAAFVVSETNVGVDGKPLPKGEKRWSSSPLAITPTVVR
jgi:hypothetical protein